jgi:hypothetical protein
MNPVSTPDPDIELQSQAPNGKPSDPANENTVPPNIVSNSQDLTTIPRRNLKLLSAGFSFFVAGVNDGSMGPLLPYMLKDYNIGTSFIAIL